MESFKQNMTPSMMSDHMKNSMHSEKNAKRTMGSFVCMVILNAVMAGIWGWFLFPDSNLDIYKRYEWDLTRIEETKIATGNPDIHWTFTDKQKGQFWLSGACFYTPTTTDGMEYQTIEFEWNPDNRNQRCVSCEYGFCFFIFFIVSIFNVINGMCLCMAFKKKMNGCLKCANCCNCIASCLAFVFFIGMSCARWSEGGRACAGEFWEEEA